MRAIPVTVAVTIALLASGCFLPTGPEMHFTRSKPSETELIGTWRPTADTLKDIRDRGRYLTVEHELILRSDHTFSMRNMPDGWHDGLAEPHGHFDSGEGTWELAPKDNAWQIWVVYLHFAEVRSHEPKVQAYSGMTVHLYHQRSPYLIFVELGDPDLGLGMLFERTKT